MILENQSLHLENERLRTEVAGLKAERDEARAEVTLTVRRLSAERDALCDVIRKSCDDHIALAAEYEAGGNTRGAMQLRAVGNMLGVILQGGTPTTVCPPVASREVD